MNPSQTQPIVALIPCAGAGLRAGGERPKQYQMLAGEPLVSHTLAAMAKVSRISQTLLVVAPDDTWAAPILADLAQRIPNHSVQLLPAGGASRAQTVLNGLTALLGAGHSPDTWVLVHDAARCLITPEQINHLIDECEHDPVGGLLACPVTDTLKIANLGKSQTTLSRDGKWAAQTPQMFRLEPLRAALQAALHNASQTDQPLTDEASAFEALALTPKLVANTSPNFKVTYADDFVLAEALLQQRRNSPTFRIGEGWDTHQLVDQATTGRKLILGGINIPYSKGLLGHSDADALCHAITDALLGAAGLGDIGKHFPDTDPRYQGADSLSLLQHTAQLIQASGWAIANVDSTIVAEAPKMAPHIDAMRQSLAAALGLSASQVNVKAKTAEKLGPVGEGLSIETRAVVMLVQAAAVL